MTEKEFMDLFNVLDEQVLKLFLESSYEYGQEYYNKLILEGWDPDEAMYDVMMKTSYRALKFAVATSLFFTSNIESEEPKTKEELKRLLTIIE